VALFGGTAMVAYGRRQGAGGLCCAMEVCTRVVLCFL